MTPGRFFIAVVALCLASPARGDSPDDFLIYTDGLAPGWEDRSISVQSLNLCTDFVVYEGECSLAVDPRRLGGPSFLTARFYTGLWDTLRFQIHGGSVGDQQLQVFLHTPDGGPVSVGPAISLNNPAYIDGGSVDAGIWKEVNIPLADLHGADRTISRVSIQAVDDSPLFYIDDVRLVAGEPKPFQIAVDAGNVLGPLPRTLFGSGALSSVVNLHEDVDAIAKLQRSGVSVVRFPGGVSSDSYHWQDHVPGQPGYDPEIPDTTDTVEFMAFVQAIGAEPLMTVNFCTGSAQEAADWVRFTNVENGWGVKYWEIGNEIYGGWACPAVPVEPWVVDANSYVNGDATHDGFTEICHAMKAVDPSIKVGLVGEVNRELYNGWAGDVLDFTDDCVDFYVVHRYPLWEGRLWYRALLGQPARAWPGIARDLRELYIDHGRGRSLNIAVTEYNSYPTNPGILTKQTVNMLYLADVVGQFATHGVALANHHVLFGDGDDNNIDNRYGLLLADQNNFRQPSYYAYPLWDKAGDERLASTIDLHPEEMAVYGSRHSKTGDVTLIVINKGPTRTGTITIDNFEPDGRVEAYMASGDGLTDETVAFNGDEDPPIALETVAPFTTAVLDSNFTHPFLGYSVTSLTVRNVRCDLDNNGIFDESDVLRFESACIDSTAFWTCDRTGDQILNKEDSADFNAVCSATF